VAKQPNALTVREHLRHYLRPLTTAERTLLEQSLLADGCRDPLVVWVDGKERVLVDGHHRHDLCRLHDLPFTTVEHAFEDEEEVLRWMFRNGTGRRNMKDPEKHYHIGARYLRLRRDPRDTLKRGSDPPRGHGDHAGDRTCEAIARDEGLGEKTVRRYARIAEQIDELAAHLGDQVKWDILAGLLVFSPKLYRRLTEATPDEARTALAAARADAADPEKPLAAAAVIKHLPSEDDSTAPEEETPVGPFNASFFLSPLFDPIRARVESLSPDELSTVVDVLKSYVTNLEGTLRRKQAV
jgi:hypothetical protein